jgi:nicotinamidase-related amidase
MKNAVLIIDPQNDFCVAGRPLCVPGAWDDMQRMADFILKNKSSIDFIGVTMDSHQIIDISHPAFWQDKDGKNPGWFTIITAADVRAGIWTANYAPQEALKYLDALESQKEYPHCIWPEHCITGTEGAAVVKPIMDAIAEWCRLGNFIQIVAKGNHPLTEHFGAFQAQVPVAGQAYTQMNTNLINTLEKYPNVYLAGEARSHCVANTLKQALTFPVLTTKLIIIEDAMSNVTGFETLGDPTFAKAKAANVRFAKTTDPIL